MVNRIVGQVSYLEIPFLRSTTQLYYKVPSPGSWSVWLCIAWVIWELIFQVSKCPRYEMTLSKDSYPQNLIKSSLCPLWTSLLTWDITMPTQQKNIPQNFAKLCVFKVYIFNIYLYLYSTWWLIESSLGTVLSTVDKNKILFHVKQLRGFFVHLEHRFTFFLFLLVTFW